jgi:hypothetical protein
MRKIGQRPKTATGLQQKKINKTPLPHSTLDYV